MPFFDFVSSAQKATTLALGPNRHFYGTVLWNNDPKQVGAIRCQIPGLMEFSSVESYPFIYPHHEIGLRGSHPMTMVRIPVVGSHVICIFPHDNIYFGFYIIE